MNKQNLKIAIGAGALLLIGGYLVYEWYKSEKDNNSKECTKKFNSDCNDEYGKTSVSTNVINTEDECKTDDLKERLNESKTEIVQSMQERHEEAAQIMKEALENIRSEQVYTESENNATLDELNSQLDDLMN